MIPDLFRQRFGYSYSTSGNACFVRLVGGPGDGLMTVVDCWGTQISFYDQEANRPLTYRPGTRGTYVFVEEDDA